MLKISVAMTTCNGEKYIKEQLNSVLNQLRRPDEVIITDDVSADGTVEIIRSFIKEHRLTDWKLIINEERLGFKQNFKKAISLTTGDIIFLCDQDDVWCEDKTESLLSLFTKNDRLLAVSSAFTVIDGNGTVSDVGHTGNNHGLICARVKHLLQRIDLKTVMRCNISPGCTSAYRRQVAEKYLETTDGTLPHDYELNLIAAAENGLYFYNAPLIKYRIHGGNTLGLSGKEQTRLEIAEEKLSAAETVFKASGDSRLYRLCEKRLDILKNRRTAAAVTLIFSPSYRKYYTLREWAGDILYTKEV